MKPSLLILLVSSTLVSNLSVAEVQWTEAREGVKIGVDWVVGQSKGNGAIMLTITESTNYAKNLVIPPAHQSLKMTLKDSKGKPVSLTEEGAKYRAAVETNMSRSRKVSRQIRLWPTEPTPLASFWIDDCFAITELGEYEFQIQVTLIKELGPVELRPVEFNSIKLALKLSPNKSVPESSLIQTNKP